MIEMFEILRREARRDPSSVDVFFSSHPAPADRIEGLRAEVVRVRGGTRDTRQFHSVKTRLLKMPAARAMPRQ
jgi:predicted Zn-dependent protease